MPHKRPTEELQADGQILYKRKEFAKALDLFNKAIVSEPNLTVSLLDNRSATHEKLGDIKAALQDAKHAIRLNEKDPTGYLRAGRLLEQAGKSDTALGIYGLGIKKKTKNVELLVKRRTRLLHSTVMPKAADPLTQLPIELVEMILANLNFRQIVICTRVSKQWNTFIASLPSLWTSLDLSEARAYVGNSFVSLCMNRSHHQITTANLHRLSSPDKVITALAHRCKNLHSLAISKSQVLDADFVHQMRNARNLAALSLGTHAPMNLHAVSKLLGQLSSLTSLEVKSVIVRERTGWPVDLPNLQTLKLVADPPTPSWNSLNLSSLLQRTPNLLSLTISGIQTTSRVPSLDLHTSCPKLEKVDFSHCDLATTNLASDGLPPSLRIVLANESMSRSNYLDMTPASHYLPALKELFAPSPMVAHILLSVAHVLDYIDPATRDVWTQDAEIMKILLKDPEQLSRLTSFSMGSCHFTNEFPVLLESLLVSPRLSDLEHLSLTDLSQVDDVIAESIAKNFDRLKTLDLSRTAVTGYGIKKIVESCKDLKMLTLRSCSQCSGDAIDWARGQGIVVNITSDSSGGTKGKKVRYGH